jgi:hypothetical protein
MKLHQEVSLVLLAELYLYFFKQDHALAHALADPRAMEITEESIDLLHLAGLHTEDAIRGDVTA